MFDKQSRHRLFAVNQCKAPICAKLLMYSSTRSRICERVAHGKRRRLQVTDIDSINVSRSRLYYLAK